MNTQRTLLNWRWWVILLVLPVLASAWLLALPSKCIEKSGGLDVLAQWARREWR